jgi:hypothetical protein
LPLNKAESLVSRVFVAATVACAVSCAPLADVPPVPPAKSRSTALGAHTLTLAALDCVMAPVVYDKPPWASDDDQVVSFGPDASSCVTAARAAHVGSARVYRVDSDALLDVRHAIRRGSTAGSREGLDMLALFDESIAAIMEARRARTALVREAPHPSPEGVDKIRARAMVVKLDDFGRRRGGSLGLEARAVAHLVAANGFLQVARVDSLVRPYVAEPLFTMMFGSEFLSDSPDEAPASWGEYVAAAARAIPRSANEGVAQAPETSHADKAIGGGPAENTRGDLRAVTDAAAAELRSLAASLPDSRLRVALNRTVENLVAFDVESALTAKVSQK